VCPEGSRSWTDTRRRPQAERISCKHSVRLSATLGFPLVGCPKFCRRPPKPLVCVPRLFEIDPAPTLVAPQPPCVLDRHVQRHWQVAHPRARTCFFPPQRCVVSANRVQVSSGMGRVRKRASANRRASTPRDDHCKCCWPLCRFLTGRAARLITPGSHKAISPLRPGPPAVHSGDLGRSRCNRFLIVRGGWEWMFGPWLAPGPGCPTAATAGRQHRSHLTGDPLEPSGPVSARHRPMLLLHPWRRRGARVTAISLRRLPLPPALSRPG